MREENSTENLTINYTVRLTPDALVDPTWQFVMTMEFCFKYVVLGITIFGTAANGLTIYALCAHNARDAKKRVINLLIINQNLLDLTCCVLFVITISIQISNIYLMGALGYFLCTIFVNNTAVHCTLYGSIINLVALTGERYLKVVHPFWSKKHLKRWVVYAAMVFAWIGGILFVVPVSLLVSQVKDGSCFAHFEAQQSELIYHSFSIAIFFFLPLIVFVYCYGHIVFVMRRQMRVMAGHTGEGSSQMSGSQAQSKRVKWNIIKTMIIVSVAYIICWSPMNVLHLYEITVGPTIYAVAALYPALFLIYLYICMNPFIYGLKHEGVKQELARLMNCCKSNEVGDWSGNRSSNRAGGTK